MIPPHENSLLSTILSLYLLLFLYFPSLSFQFIFSPVILSTLILLLYLLRLGASQNSSIRPPESDSAESDSVDDDRRADAGKSDPKQERRPIYADSFVEWDVRAPLEVIHEEYEGEDAEEHDWEARRESEMDIIRRYASLSLFYPESDSDASSEGDFLIDGGWNSPEKTWIRWEEEDDDDDKDGLIEIALDEKRNCEVEEENLIEIDISPTRRGGFPAI